jgi:preprotein translocase subunit SecD
VGPPLFSADSVASATARPDASGGERWVVSLRPNEEGRLAVETLLRQPGAQVVVLVEGQVVAAPRLDASMLDEVVVTGVDESVARNLADRLNG